MFGSISGRSTGERNAKYRYRIEQRGYHAAPARPARRAHTKTRLSVYNPAEPDDAMRGVRSGGSNQWRTGNAARRATPRTHAQMGFGPAQNQRADRHLVEHRLG